MILVAEAGLVETPLVGKEGDLLGLPSLWPFLPLFDLEH